MARTAAAKGYQRFLQAFENEGAKDSVWWLPGRRGEAFAIHKERFERTLLKIYFDHNCFSAFAADLKRWYVFVPCCFAVVLLFAFSLATFHVRLRSGASNK